MRSVRATVATGVIAALFGASAALGQNSDAVSIVQEPIVVIRRYFSDDNRHKHNARVPHTDWQFRCLPALSYDIVENKTELLNSRHMVTLKINGVRLKMSVPIVMTIAKNEPQSTVVHEFGHVQICSDIYAAADRKMLYFSNSLLGKSYSGSGSSVDEACAAALKEPLGEISQRFTSITNDRAKRISKFYDYLDANTKFSTKTQIEMAERNEAVRFPTP